MTTNPVTQAMRLMLDRGVFAHLPCPSAELLRLLTRQRGRPLDYAPPRTTVPGRTP
jgi:hypothetical protein